MYVLCRARRGSDGWIRVDTLNSALSSRSLDPLTGSGRRTWYIVVQDARRVTHPLLLRDGRATWIGAARRICQHGVVERGREKGNVGRVSRCDELVSPRGGGGGRAGALRGESGCFRWFKVSIWL